MAHDLRAPLNALVGYASLLDEGAFGALTGEQREISATLERLAIELVDLLGATLDVARLETGHLPLRAETFSVQDVVGGLTSGTFARASRDGHLVCALAPDLPALRSDRLKLKEIVQNLIDNALKHAAGATVEVGATLAPGRDAVRITVRDAGPGIAPELLPHLFEPFRPRPGGGRGTGFGLYIVRCFAEALGGSVGARSAPGDGTTMTVELPLVAPGLQ
jgi:signal transduction histidine kinase